MTQPESHEYILTPAEYVATQEKLDKVNARAQKRGFTGRFELAAERDIVHAKTDSGLPVEHVIYRCTLTGQAPSYGGWKFLARLDTLTAVDGDPLWIINTAPGVDASRVDRSSLKFGHCGHCETTRQNRRKLMLVRRQSTGETKQVGSTCLKDFLGWSGSPVWIDEDRVVADLELLGDSGRWAPQFTPRTVLMAALATVAEYGWSPASGGGVPTRERVGILLSASATRGDEEKIQGIDQHLTAAEAQVDVDLAEALLITQEDACDYGQNLYAALCAAEVGRRTFALVCSAVSYLARARQKASEAVKSAEFESVWLGQVDEKVSVEGEVTTCMLVEGFMPDTTQVLAVITTDTALVKIITSAQWAYADDFDRGSRVRLTGTVKKHAEYRGQKQTVLSRPKLVR